MPFDRPTLTELRAQTAADIATQLPGADALLRFSNLGVLGDILAAGVNGHYGYLDNIAQNAVPYTATGEDLEAWAALRGVTRKPAVQAAGTVQFTGTTAIPSGANVVRSDNTAYVTTAIGTVSGSVVTASVQAVTAGAAGTLTVGQVMNLGSPVSGVLSAGAVTASTTPGADVEKFDALRSRMLGVYAAPPQGGDANDYVNWALDVSGVTRAWCAPLESGAGTVSVYFMMDVTEASFNGFPQGTNGVATSETRATAATGDQLTVANALYPLRPVTALVTAKAPGANAVSFTIAGISTATTATKAAISATIANVFLAQGSPGGVVDLSYIESAVAAISGTAGFVITAVSCSHGTVSPSGDGNITSSAGYLPTVGTITYT
ncbi:MAG: baseplate J/gp47 family protein [Caulobacteraceae bacterium]|nr:baseplate J/gp47 family protein [Caulobacteraceae bacterium]